MNTKPNQTDGPVSWWGTIAGMIPFLSFTFLHIFRYELFPIYPDSGLGQQISSAMLLLGSFGIPFIGFGAGWVRGFPRWSYAYVGFSFLISLYFFFATTPGLVVLGYEFARNRWGVLACLPTVIMLLIVLALTRSMNPIRFFTNIGQDWTLLSFSLFGLMPLIASLAFDEVANSFEYPSLILLSGVMAATAGAYLRSENHRQRVFWLYLGLTICVGILTFAPIVYWLPLNGVDVPWMIFDGFLLLSIMYYPVLLGRGIRHVDEQDANSLEAGAHSPS